MMAGSAGYMLFNVRRAVFEGIFLVYGHEYRLPIHITDKIRVAGVIGVRRIISSPGSRSAENTRSIPGEVPEVIITCSGEISTRYFFQ